MDLSVREVLARIITVPDMVRAFQDEHHCRRLLEAMVWPGGRICPGLWLSPLYRSDRPGEREASTARTLSMLE